MSDATAGAVRYAWFNCQAGVAGDMSLSALIDAGADADVVGHTIGGLGIDGYAMSFERVQRCGVGALWANIVTHDALHQEQHVPRRPVSEIYALLNEADLPERVRRRSLAVFERLAAVEGAIHGVEPADVALHEVGAIDSIIDVVGVCAALESLDIDEVYSSSIGLGTGMIPTAHGVLAHPAPATAALLAEREAPTHGLPVTLETTTPTGAGLMTTLATSFGSIPRGTTRSVGYGAGTADTPGRANIVQVVVGERDASNSAGSNGESDLGGTPVIQLDANVDDVTAEVLAHTISAALDAGAHDAWLTPIVMKKGRAAHTISVLCDPTDATALRGVLVRETGTLGVRAATLQRWPERRETSTVEVGGHTIGIKVADHRVKVEFDDAAAAATALGVPVRTVIERAITAATQT